MEEEAHHILVDDAELNYIHQLRDLDYDGEDPSPERLQKLRDAGPVQVKVSVGGRHLGPYDVSNTNDIVASFAEIAVKVLQYIFSQESAGDDHSNVVDEQGHTHQALQPEAIPSYIESVIFTLAKGDLTDDRRKELDEYFPGVIIKEGPGYQALSGPNRSAKRQAAPDHPFEKPHGVKTAVFELDTDATTRDEALETNIRKQYPWATITPSINVPTAPKALRGTTSVVGDVESHLQDLATFMTEYPPDGIFDVNVIHTPSWEALPLPQKLNCAHARAIQVVRYGETRNPATRCGNCKRGSYTCRVYRQDFVEKTASTNHISLGEGCQHCRLMGVKCDLPPYHPHSASLSTGNNLEYVESSGVGRAYSVDMSSEATVTPRASRQLSLASRTSREHLSSGSHFTDEKFTQEFDLIDLARQLNLNPKRPDILWKMYDKWRISRDIRPFQKSYMNLQYYYVNLVDLNILARGINNPALEFDTLLQFQMTNFEQDEHLPDIDKAVIRAFEHLPAQAPLCRWIGILFSYVWNTVEDGDYEQFIRKNISLDPVALNKFLYAVAYIRDPHTKGGNKAVYQEWCTVHGHSPSSTEDTRCMNAERACKNMLNESSPNKADNSGKRSNKRSFAGFGTGSGPRYDKKSKRNDGHQYGSRPNSRASMVEERNAEQDENESADDAHFTGEGVADNINIGPGSLRSAGSDRQNGSTQARSTVVANDPPRRARGRPRKESVLNGSTMAAVLSNDHLDSLGVSDFGSSRAMDEIRASATKRLSETPQRDMTHSEEPTSDRRSARAKKPLPPGYFREHLPKSKFNNTMWGGFNDD